MLRIVTFVVFAIALVAAVPVKDEACPAVNGDFVTFLADEIVRAAFYICDNGYKVAMRCPGELLWNDTTKTCDFSFNLEEEDSGESDSASSESLSSESTEYDEPMFDAFVMNSEKV